MKALSSATLKKFMIEMGKGAGDVLLKYYQKKLTISRKEGAGIVTQADAKAEEYLLRKIFKKFPQSAVITEETGHHGQGDELLWILDPLDGTTNYAHGFPWFCVSIGLHVQGQPKAGLIYQPLTKECFYAEKSKGAFLNGRRLKVSKTRDLRDALLGTGFYYTTGKPLAEEIEIFKRVQDKALGVRRPGSAALDLAYVASGRYDGFWERGLSSWDVAAGFLLVTEAGGQISSYQGRAVTAFDKEAVATNGLLQSAVLELIQT
jgi:myo-inositol-1(or 4)-monophosphatase